MRKTQLLGPSQAGSANPSVFSTANWAPITLFALAYVAILGVLFAPEGYFNGEEPATVAAD